MTELRRSQIHSVEINRSIPTRLKLRTKFELPNDFKDNNMRDRGKIKTSSRNEVRATIRSGAATKRKAITRGKSALV